MKLQPAAQRQARQQTYMGISQYKKGLKTKKIKVPTLQQMTVKALNAMLLTPASQKVNTPSLNSAAQRGNESFNGFSARSSSPQSEQPFSRSVSRDYKWQDSNFSKHYAQQQKNLMMKRVPSKKNTESSESWLMDHRTIKGDLTPGTQIYCQQSPQKQQIPPLKSSKQHIKHDSLNGRFSYAFAPDTSRPQDYSPEKYNKITKKFYENAQRTSASLRDRNSLSQSDIVQTQKSTDEDLKNYLNSIQHRNLPKGNTTGFLYDGESNEPHFRKSGKGGTKGNYMKIQRTQISNLPGALPANSSPLKNPESYKKPVGVLLATTPEIKMRFGPRQESPEPGLITPLPTTSITPRPTIHKSRYTALMGTVTPLRRPLAFPAISPPKSRATEKASQNIIIPKSVVEKEFTAQDGVLEKTIGGYTQTTRDTPSPDVSRRESSSGSPNIRGLHPIKQTVMA